MKQPFLQTSIEFLKTVGPQRAEILKKELGIFTFGDLLHHFPFRYVDRSKVSTIKEIQSEEVFVQIKVRVISSEILGTKGGRRLVIHVKDDTGATDLIFFQGIKWMQDKFKPGQEYIIFGKPNEFKGRFSFVHPDIEAPGETNDTSNNFYPYYHTTEKLKTRGFDSKGIHKLIKTLIPYCTGQIPELLPEYILNDYKLIPREQAIINIHLPTSPQIIKQAELRLKFDELFFIQLRLLKSKTHRHQVIAGHLFTEVGHWFNTFYNSYLPFELTNAQKRVVKEIRRDTLSGKQMNRLVQGDVGSGKTMVAFLNMLIAADNNFQSCLMAPTEILATQHFATISEYAEKLGIKIALLTGSTKKSVRKIIHEQLLNGELKIIIGTHALLEDEVQFNNLGLVVIDEQHRFGVAQRFKLWRKNKIPPHILVMTATPIPRTLAMTLYGDLDVSVIDELPAGRKPIKTIHKYDSHRLEIFGFMKQQIALGRQIYVVYPLIKESEKLDLKDLQDGYESIAREFPLPAYRVSIVHGKMKPADKEFEMQRFVRGETHIMVATTVIEVGVNVPNASVMIIENAERFGLSQLHQLRGRVGRGAEQSYCMLCTSYKLSKEARERIDTMVRTNDGFEIAEVDLRLRGPGDIEGTQQSGILNLKIADLIKDGQLLQLARNVAQDILVNDPDLSEEKNKILLIALEEQNKLKANWSRVS